MDKKHPDSDTPVDPKYFLMGYNLIKCAQCGVPWDEHARDLACDRYRPPVDMKISSLPEIKNIVIVNLGLEPHVSGKTYNSFAKFLKRFRLTR